MIEKIVCDFLEKELKIPTYPEKPEKKLKKYILIEKTGGSSSNFISSATIAVQSYAESMFKAAELNEQVKAAMAKIVELPEIGAIRLNADYNYTDTETKSYRYQAVFEITHY